MQLIRSVAEACAIGRFGPAAIAALLAVLGSNTANAQTGGKIGYVVTDIRYALFETGNEAKEECSLGLQRSEREQFKEWPGHLAHMEKFGGTTANRGLNGEHGNFVPTAEFVDPFPFSEVVTKAGYGMNLDGTEDGRATGKTLKHEKFVSPSGEKVDNQMARVLGCVLGWRKSGFMSDFYSKEIEQQPVNRLLIEITGVDNEKNDSSVSVSVYKGLDRLVRTPDGAGFVPFMSHRVDHRAAELSFHTKGRIVNGVLETDPIPNFRQAMRQIEIMTERTMRDVRFRLKLDESAVGLMAGYENLASWWNVNSKSSGATVGRYSAPQLYQAAFRYADGYPDPKTGKATAISTAYNITAVRALIVHPNRTRTQLASASAKKK